MLWKTVHSITRSSERKADKLKSRRIDPQSKEAQRILKEFQEQEERKRQLASRAGESDE